MFNILRWNDIKWHTGTRSELGASESKVLTFYFPKLNYWYFIIWYYSKL